MKIAIMGAGLSGLACAITLEKHGLTPDIFESRREVGDRFINGEVFLNFFYKPIQDVKKYFDEKYDIHFTHTLDIKELILHSPNQNVSIKGHLGYSVIRGRGQESLEKQLGRQVKSPIHFYSKKTYEELVKSYDKVVLATGDGDYAIKYGDFKVDRTVTVKGATIEGQFDTSAPRTWLNNLFAPQGYAFCIPYSEREANISITFPENIENKHKDITLLWNRFIHEVKETLNQDVRITDEFHIENYIIGHCQTGKFDNTYLVGNCFGSIMPFLGFGQESALLSGIFAAQDILGQGDFDDLTQLLRESYSDSLILRRAWEKLDNHKFDLLVKALNNKWLDRILMSKFNTIKILAKLLKPYMRITEPN